MKPLITLLLATGLWAAEPPKPVTLTDSEKLEIARLQLRSARVDAAKLQIAAEERAVNEALTKVVQAWAAKGCVLNDDLTCQPVAKPETKK
jgi:hypothetical protein